MAIKLGKPVRLPRGVRLTFESDKEGGPTIEFAMLPSSAVTYAVEILEAALEEGDRVTGITVSRVVKGSVDYVDCEISFANPEPEAK